MVTADPQSWSTPSSSSGGLPGLSLAGAAMGGSKVTVVSGLTAEMRMTWGETLPGAAGKVTR